MVGSGHQLTDEHLALYAARFVSRRDAYLTTGTKGHWICRKQRLTERALRHALAGQRYLGLYSVDGTGLSRWACLDVDDAAWGNRLWTLIDALPEARQALLETSRRGWHLWLFVEPTPWWQVRRWAEGLAAGAGLTAVENFPKGPGYSGVRAPLTRHPKDGRVYPFVEIESGEVASDPWSLLATRIPLSVPAVLAEPGRPAVTPLRGRTEHQALVAELERHTRLRFYGSERAVGRCPLHADRHPSLGVIGGYWQCFAGCGQGGLNALRARLREKGGR